MSRDKGRAWGAALIGVSAVLLCLIPKPEGDLFFALRIGADILHTGRLPHADPYSWSNRGTLWVVPEWGAFALYALAYRAGGLLGTWALMAALALATALTAWGRAARCLGPAWAFPMVSLMLLAMSSCFQERPYAFSYLLLAVALVLLTRGRRDPGVNALFLLPPLCVLWANLHQGVIVLPLLALVYALGDLLTAFRRLRGYETPGIKEQASFGRRKGAESEVFRPQDGGSPLPGVSYPRSRAGRMALTAAGCAAAVLVSPYGWRLYGNVFVTLRDHAEMAHITEWEPAWSVPVGQMEPLLLLAGVCGLGLALSRLRPRLPDALVTAALLGEALLHVRDVALFAVGSVIVLAPHLGDAVERFRGVERPAPAWRGALLGGLALLYVGTVGLVAAATLRRAGLGRGGVGLGAAAAELPDYPGGAVAFLNAEAGPPPRRLLNDLGDGGFLLWREPRAPVFIDGRLDVYGGRTFDDNLRLVRADGSPAWAALVRHYDFDAVLTRSRREAAAFAALPGWRLVYEDPLRPGHPRHRLLRREAPEAPRP